MKSILIILLSINALCTALCNECPVFSRKNIPIKTRIGPGCTCINKYPISNYDFVDVSYIYGQNIQQNFYQNNKLIDSCPLSQSCNKRINLNNNYDLIIETIRKTKTNSYGTITNQHQINFGTNIISLKSNITNTVIKSSNECLYPPEINIEKDEQSGSMFDNCIYEYVQMISNNFVIDMAFNNQVSVIISLADNIIYNKTSSTFFDKITIDNNNNNNCIKLNISTIYNTDINWVDIYPLYDTDTNDIIDNTRTIAILSLVFSIAIIIIILIIAIFIIIKKKKKYYKYNKINNDTTSF
jgi:hypothetical protein